MKPTICICMFTHNEEKHLDAAIASLLAQSYEDFQFIILDDCSTDGTEKIILNHASRDKRIVFYKNTRTRGYGSNYRKSFRLAGNNVDYIGWAAGHDVHHPRWLEKMVDALNAHPEAVGAYPLTARISDDGADLKIPAPVFDTNGLNVKDRIRAVCEKGTGFGNMIYGLFRTGPLKKAGVYRRILIADLVVLTEMSLYGTLIQVPEVLWYRRYISLFTLARQKRLMFSPPPWYVDLPYPIVNSLCLLWHTVLKYNAGGMYMRSLGLRLFVAHFKKHYPSIKDFYPEMGRWLLQSGKNTEK